MEGNDAATWAEEEAMRVTKPPLWPGSDAVSRPLWPLRKLC